MAVNSSFGMELNRTTTHQLIVPRSLVSRSSQTGVDRYYELFFLRALEDVYPIHWQGSYSGVHRGYIYSGAKEYRPTGANGWDTSFSGGSALWPGRQLARQEVLSTLARPVLWYDIGYQVPNTWEPRMNPAFFPAGRHALQYKTNLTPHSCRRRQGVLWVKPSAS